MKLYCTSPKIKSEKTIDLSQSVKKQTVKTRSSGEAGDYPPRYTVFQSYSNHGKVGLNMAEIAITWHYGIVVLSVITAIISSYVTLSVADHLRVATVWTIPGTSTMGLII